MQFLTRNQRSCLKKLSHVSYIEYDKMSKQDRDIYNFLVSVNLAENKLDYKNSSSFPGTGAIRPVSVSITQLGRSCLSEHFYNDKKFIIPTVISVFSLIVAIIALIY